MSSDDMAYLEELTAAVVDASRVAPDAKVGAIGPNVTGGTLIRPGGRDCYPAFWIRDYAMSLESGLVTPGEQRQALVLTARHQQDEQWRLRSGSIVPPGSIADHISFGGKPIFYPGTLEDYEGQGGAKWGKLPSLDDHFFLVHMAAVHIDATADTELLERNIRGAALVERLERAFAMPPSREDTGLVYADLEARGVSFGFTDVVTHTGDLLFCSVLKYRAAVELASLLERLNRAEDAQRYRALASRLKGAIADTFALDDGFLRASTGVSGQHDVWGTAFAIYVDALEPVLARKACEALAQAYREGTIAWQGMIRHVPTDRDFSDSTAWEQALAAKNRYQNGAYWPTATGWVCYAIATVDRASAARLAAEYVAALRADDFRKGPKHGAPWECMHPDGDHRQNPVYMTSVTCPLAAFRRLEGADER
ncbi:MAG TPA: hypothetical protein ENN80_03885 [Candidatus Hydrogenedentes bacterium]|nr:hypothetical protein [Candidatus Hydrogenedentota bacterium]